MLALVDVNNMYVSCERVFRPALNGKPVVVLSNNDGNCIARSNEAKDLGIRMAQPWFEVRHLERSAGLVALSANFELYGDMSNRMMSLAAQHAPRQEIYSIDECFLDFDGVQGTAGELAERGRALRRQVLKWTGLPCSVGFGPTKTLAKLANHLAKTADRKPASYPAQLSARIAQVCHLGELTPAEHDELMRRTDAGAVWGVGPRTRARLDAGGIRSVLDLVRADAVTLGRQFSVVLQKTVLELQGVPCLDIDDAPAANQQIMCSRSFGSPVTALPELTEVVSQFASRVAQKLRDQGSVANAVQVFIATSPFRKSVRQHAPSATLPLARPSGDTLVLVSAALRALRSIYREGHRYVKAGVVLVDLQDAAIGAAVPGTTIDMFADGGESTGMHESLEPNAAVDACRDCSTEATARRGLMGAIDALNGRFGRDAVAVASAAAQARFSAHLSRQQRRSPRCTTRVREVVTATA
jgi:DNA polymerase V